MLFWITAVTECHNARSISNFGCVCGQKLSQYLKTLNDEIRKNVDGR